MALDYAEIRSRILLVLEAAGPKGADCRNISEAIGTEQTIVVGQLQFLLRKKRIHVVDLTERPRRCCLPVHGGQAYKPVSKNLVAAAVQGPSSARLVVSIGDERKSITLAAARSLYQDLKELFK